MRRLPTLLAVLALALAAPAAAKPKIYVSFHWHMHQPIYWPYESVVQSQDAGRWSFDLMQIHNDRSGPYTTWPIDAVQQGLALPHLGAQVSFTCSLMENLGAIEAAGRGFGGWRNGWIQSRALTTSLGNPRLDLTMIGQHHPLMPLVPGPDRRLQIELHKRSLEASFGAAAKGPQGIFPPETAFAEHVIPDFAAAGVKWALVDNIHFDRARPDYPYSPGSNLYPPNAADQRNTSGSVNWVQLQNLWAPTKVSAPWGYQPHWVEYVDPESGLSTRIVAVPAARYEGNEDARGGYGAFLYEAVMSQYEAFNTDDLHPMLIVLHHDGDNYGGGTDSYYHSNFANFVSWISSQPDRFEASTIQDYLDRFPPDAADVIHVEPGSWSGADNGDPEFLKWNGDPGADGYSPDRNSWGVLVAAANRVHTAQAIAGYTSLDAIRSGTGNETDLAWHHLLNGETSCYWYWDNAEGGKLDSHPARAANLAVQHADAVIAGGTDGVPPTIYLPQREPYNPGAIEWGTQAKPSDFDVWTYVYDVSGLSNVTLRYRVTPKGTVDRTGQTYAASGWLDLPMQAKAAVSRTDPAPTYQADEYRATIAGVKDSLVDYYVAATDSKGQLARSPIQHVYVGTGGGTNPPAGKVGWTPPSPTRADVVTFFAPKPGKLHWGVDGWKVPPSSLQPAGTVAFDAKSVETPLAGQMVQTEKFAAVGMLAGGVAHEINNPLGAVLAFTQLMLREEGRSGDDLETLSDIEHATLRCKRIVESLLRFSRREALARKTIDLNKAVEDASVLFGAQLRCAPKAKLVTRLSPTSLAVLGDANEIEQVVLNLLMNALQALSEAGGTVTLSTREAGDAVEVSVQDTGMGIPAEHRSKIFNLGFTTKPPGEGTGFGLAISWSIAQAHGGRIDFESEPGRGTTFTLRLPAVAALGSDSDRDRP